jgi:putative pyruvate formate lyase activating enzyme
VYKAYDYPEIARRITSEEYDSVVRRAEEVGLTNLDIQGEWLLIR